MQLQVRTREVGLHHVVECCRLLFPCPQVEFPDRLEPNQVAALSTALPSGPSENGSMDVDDHEEVCESVWRGVTANLPCSGWEGA